ncbi:MAG TPA: class I SAM-dependent methyltransferase [Polyangia bacterium]
MATAAVAVGVVVAVRNTPPYEQRNAVRWADNRFQALKPFLRENAVAAELGVLKGDLSRLLVRDLKPAKIHLVDPWYLQGPEWSWEHGDRSTVHALIGILKDFESELARGQVVLNIAFDQDFLAALPDAYFDWVYLDTTHEYQQTKLELQLFQKKVKPSGVIAGDDWRPDPTHPHHGVYKAVQELIAEGQYEILYADTQNLQWVIARKDRSAKTP